MVLQTLPLNTATPEFPVTFVERDSERDTRPKSVPRILQSLTRYIGVFSQMAFLGPHVHGQLVSMYFLSFSL